MKKVLASLALAVALVACVVVACEGGQPVWKVQKQTEAQKLAYETLKERAKQNSEEATPVLLAYLDSPEFRGNISTLPEEITSLSSEELLKLLNDTLLLSTVTHGIHAEFATAFEFLDISLEEIVNMNLTFIPNLWERFTIGELSPNNPFEGTIAAIENTAEVEVFLLPNFTSPLTELPLNQSQNRISYGALNIFQGAAGSQWFGSVQFVLRPKYYEDMLIVAPYDTGTYSYCCLIHIDGFPTNSCRMQTFENGTCYPIALGTAKHWNHLFLQSQNFWDLDVLVRLFHRLFGQPQAEVFIYEEGVYFEADILGNLILPDAAQYVIGDFSTLFGQPAGQLVMKYCASQGLPLVWALGVVNADQMKVVMNKTIEAPMNQSLFDPTILALNITGMPNVTASQASIEWFQQAWQLVNTSLIANPAAQNSTAFWVEAWNKFWGNLEEVHFNQLRPGNCEDVKHCFGVDDSGVCYCRYPKDSYEEDEAEPEKNRARVNTH